MTKQQAGHRIARIEEELNRLRQDYLQDLNCLNSPLPHMRNLAGRTLVRMVWDAQMLTSELHALESRYFALGKEELRETEESIFTL